MTGTPFRTDNQDIKHVGPAALPCPCHACCPDVCSATLPCSLSACRAEHHRQRILGQAAARALPAEFSCPALTYNCAPHLSCLMLQDMALKPFMLMDALSLGQDEKCVKDLCFLELAPTPEEVMLTDPSPQSVQQCAALLLRPLLTGSCSTACGNAEAAADAGSPPSLVAAYPASSADAPDAASWCSLPYSCPWCCCHPAGGMERGAGRAHVRGR